MNKTALARSLASFVLTGALVFGMTLTASADVPDESQSGQVPCGTIVRVSDPRGLSDSTTWPNSSSWRVDGQGPGTLSISRALTSANSVTGTGGASYSAISASVGFNVTKSSTVTTSFSITLASGEKRQIQVGQVWQRKSFKWTKQSGCAGNMTTTTGTEIAKNFLRYTYRSVKI